MKKTAWIFAVKSQNKQKNSSAEICKKVIKMHVVYDSKTYTMAMLGWLKFDTAWYMYLDLHSGMLQNQLWFFSSLRNKQTAVLC